MNQLSVIDIDFTNGFVIGVSYQNNILVLHLNEDRGIDNKLNNIFRIINIDVICATHQNNIS